MTNLVPRWQTVTWSITPWPRSSGERRTNHVQSMGAAAQCRPPAQAGHRQPSANSRAGPTCWSAGHRRGGDMPEHDHTEIYNRGLQFDLSTLMLRRRRLLGLVAGAGLATLVGCTTAGEPAAPSPTSTGATSGGGPSAATT